MLKTSCIAVVLLGGMFPTTVLGDEGLPPTLAAALKGAELDPADGWAFRKTMEVAAMSRHRVRSVTQWDLSKPAGKRCTVVSVEVLQGDTDDATDEDPCGEGHDRITYRDLADLIGKASIEPLSENEDAAEFRLRPGKGQNGFSMGSMHINLAGDSPRDLVGLVTVVKPKEGSPYVQSVAFTLDHLTGNLLARVHKLDIRYDFAPEPETGARLLRRMSLDTEVQLLASIGITTTIDTKYDDYLRRH